MAMIARKAKVTLSALSSRYASKGDIVTAIIRGVDARLVTRFEKQKWGKGDTTHDKLFDVVMTRFEIMQENREGIVSILKSFRHDPLAGMQQVFPLKESFTWMAHLAGIETAGIKGALRLKGLGLVGGYALRAWLYDTSDDLAKTMAALDQALRQAGKLAECIRL